jgi:Endodeoxyribonuclease RusA
MSSRQLALVVVVDIEPGRVKTNGRLVPQKLRGAFTGRLVLSATYRAGLDEMALQVRQACVTQRWRQTSKPVRVAVTTWWPGTRGDLDATAKSSLDALTQGGAIADDAQVVALMLSRGTDRANPRIEIQLAEVLE